MRPIHGPIRGSVSSRSGAARRAARAALPAGARQCRRQACGQHSSPTSGRYQNQARAITIPATTIVKARPPARRRRRERCRSAGTTSATTTSGRNTRNAPSHIANTPPRRRTQVRIILSRSACLNISAADCNSRRRHQQTSPALVWYGAMPEPDCRPMRSPARPEHTYRKFYNRRSAGCPDLRPM